MKGMIMFFTILLLVTAIVIIAAYSPLYQGAAQAGQLSAERYASEISGIINIMQQSPPGTSHSYELPDKECILTLGDRVTMTLSPGEKEAKASVGTIQYAAAVVPARFDCSEHDQIVFERNENIIIVRG